MTDTKASRLFASIVSPTTVLLTIRKSRSTSGMTALQKEVQHHDVMSDEGAMHRSHSLPSAGLSQTQHTSHATAETVGGSEDGIVTSGKGRVCTTGETSTAGVSSSRVCQMEEEMTESKVTVATLEKTISHMKAHIETLEGQLQDESQNSELLKEELDASRRLCCQLHEACSRGDVTRSKHASHSAKHVAVQHRFVQTFPSLDRKTESTEQPQIEQMDSVKVARIVGMLHRDARMAEDYQDKVKMLENEIVEIQQECKERDFQVRTITQQLSGYIHRSTKLEAEQVSLRENLRRANGRNKSSQEQLVRSNTLLDKTLCQLNELQEGKVTVGKRCTELEDRAATYEVEVTSLKEELSYSNQKCRSLNRKIQVLMESLENTQGEVTQKETALETKNTILEAIKTIAYTSPSPLKGTPRKGSSSSSGTSTKQWTNAQEDGECPYGPLSEQSGHANDTRHRQLTGNKNDNDDSEYRPRLLKTYNQSESPSRFSHGNNQYANDYEVSETDNSLTDRQSETDSQSDVSCPYQDALTDSNKGQARCKRRVSRDRHHDADDEDDHDDEDLCEADLASVGAESSVGEIDVKYGVEAEGLLLRKREQENYAMRSRHRSWEYVYIVQHGTLLWFYETRDHKMRGKTLRDEQPVDLMDAYVTVAMEYTRKKHVFRVQLATGQQYIFQARDDREMLYWVCCMDSAARCQTASTNGIPPSIGSVAVPLMGSPSKSDRIRRVIQSSLSALTK